MRRWQRRQWNEPDATTRGDQPEHPAGLFHCPTPAAAAKEMRGLAGQKSTYRIDIGRRNTSIPTSTESNPPHLGSCRLLREHWIGSCQPIRPNQRLTLRELHTRVSSSFLNRPNGHCYGNSSISTLPHRFHLIRSHNMKS